DQPHLPAHGVRVWPLLSETALAAVHPADRAIPPAALLWSAGVGRRRRTHRRNRDDRLAVPSRLWGVLLRGRPLGLPPRRKPQIHLAAIQNVSVSSRPNASWQRRENSSW